MKEKHFNILTSSKTAQINENENKAQKEVLLQENILTRKRIKKPTSPKQPNQLHIWECPSFNDVRNLKSLIFEIENESIAKVLDKLNSSMHSSQIKELALCEQKYILEMKIFNDKYNESRKIKACQ